MSAPFTLCMERYERRVPWVPNVVAFPCQHPHDHAGPHSWDALRTADDLQIAALEALNRQECNDTITDARITALLHNIDKGDYDPYIESILAVAHERKRALRGRRTFPLVSD